MGWLRRLHHTVRGSDVAEEFDEETRFHLEELVDENVKRGMSPSDARRQALRRLGNLTLARDKARDVVTVRWLAETGGDARYALRSLARNPGFSLLAILTLALGIGANTAIFSVGDAILLQALPYPDAERLVALRSTRAVQDGGSPPDGERTAGANLADWSAQAQSFEAIAGYYWRSVDLTGGDRSERLQGLIVTPEFFEVFGARQTLGRVFTAQDQGTATIILSRNVWEHRFSSDPNLIGKPLDVNVFNLRRVGPTPLHVLGVVSTDVYFPPLTADFQLGVANLTKTVDFWLPTFRTSTSNRDERLFDIVGKLRPGVTIAQAQAEMDAITSRLASAYPASNRGLGVRVVPLRYQIVGGAPRAVLWLSLCTAMVLLIAWGNVASLLLARGVARQREVAIRSALGAGRLRIIRQFLVESALLALPAAVFGALVTWWSIALLRPLLPGVALLQGIAMNGRVLSVTLLCAVLTAGLTGIMPALRISRVGRVDVAWLAGRGLSPDRGRHRTLQALVASEVALTSMLLIATGLMVTSAMRLWRVDPGFNPEHLLTMTISLPSNKFEWKHNVVFSRQVIDSVTSLGPVRAAAVIQGVPMRSGSFWGEFEVEGQPAEASGALPVARLRVVSPGYFNVMEVPIRSGRDFDGQEGAEEIIDGFRAPTQRHVIVNQNLASHYWPGQDAVGKRMRLGRAPYWTTIIGVVGDVRYAGMDSEPEYDLYYPEALFPQAATTLVVRTRGDPLDAVADIRSRIGQVDREAFVTDIRPMDELIADSLASRRSSTILLVVFAGIALLLTLMGIYGVIAQAIVQRRLEIGIRAALGAQRLDIVKMIVGEGVKLGAVGLIVGLAVASGVTRMLANLLYGVAPTDPWAFALASLWVLTLVTIASYLPARKAMRIDPAAVLRSE